MRWLQVVVVLLAVSILSSCSRLASETSGENMNGKRTISSAAEANGSPLVPPAVAKVNYSTQRLEELERKIAQLATTQEAEIAVGYDGAGNLVAWLTMIRRGPEYRQPAWHNAALATVAQIFEVAREITGVWVVLSPQELEIAYFPRSSYETGGLRPYSGDLSLYKKADFLALARKSWSLERKAIFEDDLDRAITRQLRGLLDGRIVTVEVTHPKVEAADVRVVVRGLPGGEPGGAMEEWARISVATVGRFYDHEVSLKSLEWVDESGKLLLSSWMPRKYYEAWWLSGLKPGRWLQLGSPIGGSAEPRVAVYRDLEPDRTSYRGPWWEAATSLSPIYKRVAEKQPGAGVLFAGRQGGQLVVALWMDLPDSASLVDAWSAQMKSALDMMEEPISEVWVFTGMAKGVSGALLDRMTYDSLRYPDPKLPATGPELWPFVTREYGDNFRETGP